LEAVTTRLEGLAARGGAGSAAGAGAAAGGAEVAAFVTAFDDFIAASVTPALNAGRALGNKDLTAQLDNVEAAYKAQREFLVVVSKAKKPEVLTFQKLLKPTTDALARVDSGVVNGDFANHMKGVKDGLACLGWVTVEPAPVPYIKEFTGSFLFYGNKVLREFKEKDVKHVEFVNLFRDSINALADYVKQYHTTGVAWNPNGKAAADVAAAPSSSPAAPKPPAAPAAAPAPPAPTPSAGDSKAAPPPTAALFSALNQGASVTSGLKKVTDDMKTHKNPNLRAGAVVPVKETADTAPAAAAAGTKAAPVVLPPKVELRDKVWWVENQRGNKEIVIDETNPKQSIYISNCFDSVVQIKGKVNQITVDKSDKTGIVFESVMASVEVINSKRMQLQVLGAVHTLALDKVQEIQIYLSAESLGAKITSSVSCDINVSLPPKNEGDDYTEIPIPYQFQTTIVNGKLITEPVRHE